jgi:hypothetical protein
MGIQGWSLSNKCHWSANKAFAQVGMEQTVMRGKLLKRFGLVFPTVQRQTYNKLGRITCVENSTYLGKI